MPNATTIALIPLLPLAGFILLGLFGRKYLKSSSGLIGTALLLTSTILAEYYRRLAHFRFLRVAAAGFAVVAARHATATTAAFGARSSGCGTR